MEQRKCKFVHEDHTYCKVKATCCHTYPSCVSASDVEVKSNESSPKRPLPMEDTSDEYLSPPTESDGDDPTFTPTKH